MRYTKYLRNLMERAEHGNSDAQYSLGFRYETGDGVEQDIERAVYWYEKALYKKHDKAFQRLVFINGKPAIENAANSGYDKAQYILGDMYYFGIGVKKDEKRAINLYHKASKQRLEKAFYRLMATGLGKAAVEKYANEGSYTAQRIFGYMYHSGIGVEQNLENAVYWYRRAAMQGWEVAQHSLGNMYFHGAGGVKQNYKTAAYWYRKAAKQGYSNAQYCLGNMYKSGDGVKKDMTKAIYWYEKAAEQGHTAAQCALYKIYRPKRTK